MYGLAELVRRTVKKYGHGFNEDDDSVKERKIPRFIVVDRLGMIGVLFADHACPSVG